MIHPNLWLECDFFFLNNLLLLPRFMRFALGVNKKSANYSVVNALLSRAASQTWTGDLRVTNALLYQLSYSGGLSLVYGVQNYSFIWENKKNPTIF